VQTRKGLAIAAILLSTFLAAAESTIIATAMPSVVRDLGGLELYGWTSALYMLAMTVTIPIWGKLADLRGRKPVIVSGIVTFLVGSAACALAPSMGALIAARVLQGVGAGGVQPIAMTIMGDMFAPKERARMQGVFGAVWGVAAIIGPLLGGFIVRALSWRWVFWFNVPFGALAIVLMTIALDAHDDSAPKAKTKFDAIGAALLSASVLALLAAASGYAPLLLAPVSAISLALFVIVERNHDEPLLPLDLMRQRVIAVANASGGVIGGVMTASVIYLPLYAQAVLGASPTAAGAIVAPMLVGWPLASAAAGRMLFWAGGHRLVRAGCSVVALSAIVLDYLVHHGSTPNAMRVCMFCFGTGMGLANTALIITVQDSVPFSRRGVATASIMFFRTIGGAIAVGVLGAIVAHVLAGRVPEAVLDALLGPDHGRSLGDEVARYRTDVQAGMTPIFHVLAVLAILGAGLGMLFPRVHLGAPKDLPAGEVV